MSAYPKSGHRNWPVLGRNRARRSRPPAPRRSTAAGSGEPLSPDRTTSGQRLVNCLFRISSSKGATGEDEIVSGHAINHDPALLARIERQPFEDFNHPADLHAFGQKTRERCALRGDGFVGTTCHARKRRRCRTESRPTSGAALRGGRDLQPLTRLSNLLHLSKKKGTGAMAGPLPLLLASSP